MGGRALILGYGAASLSCGLLNALLRACLGYFALHLCYSEPLDHTSARNDF